MSENIITGGPAFPAKTKAEGIYLGMTLRDYFAVAALQGMYAAYGGNPPEPDKVVDDAYDIADLMIERRWLERGVE